MTRTLQNKINFFNLSAFYFFYFAAVGVYIIFLPKVLYDLGYSPSQIGIVYALSPLMRFITPFFFLKHIELNKKIFINALIVCIFSAISFYLTIDNFYTFLLSNLILGMSLSLVLPYMEIYAIELLGKEKYGKSRLYGSIGFALVAFVLAKMLDDSYMALHFYLVVTVGTAIFAILIVANEKDKTKKALEGEEKFSIFKHWSFWLSLFFMQVSFGGFYNFFTIYETSHGISLETTSYLWIFGVVCEIILFYYQAPLLKKNLLTIIKFSLLITAFRWMIVYLYPENLYLMYFSQSIHAISFGLYHSAVILYLYNMYEDKKLAQQFMYGVAYGLGGFVGALLSGWLYGENLFLYCALITFAGYLVLFKNKA
jgi:PPP family 3-phenylpropionic acid transporter